MRPVSQRGLWRCVAPPQLGGGSTTVGCSNHHISKNNVEAYSQAVPHLEFTSAGPVAAAAPYFLMRLDSYWLLLVYRFTNLLWTAVIIEQRVFTHCVFSLSSRWRVNTLWRSLLKSFFYQIKFFVRVAMIIPLSDFLTRVNIYIEE